MIVDARERAAHADALVGRQLGHYQLVGVVGRGGMAVVYRALQITLNRYVAIKVLPPQFAYLEGFRQRFQQEAATAARLDHPHILPIFDYGEAGDVLYIVMPLIAGGALTDLMRTAPPPQVLPLYCQVLDALEYAHGMQVVHRDIKPGNVLLAQGPRALLTDFGIAKLVENATRMTNPGALIGTPAYMAPEQSHGLRVDHRADLYAMGVLLYEIVTGRRPFEGDSLVALVMQHARDAPPPPSRVAAGLPSVWDEVLRVALAKPPEQRYPSAAAMRAVVEAAWQATWPAGGAAGGRAPTAAARGVLEAATPATLYEEARADLNAGRYEAAASKLDQLALLAPGHPEVAALRNQLAAARQRQERVVAWYDHGLRALSAGDWPGAIAAFAGVTGEAPGFRDAAARLAEARLAYQLALTLDRARTTLNVGQPTQARALLEEVVQQGARVPAAAALVAAARAQLDALAPSAATSTRQEGAADEPRVQQSGPAKDGGRRLGGKLPLALGVVALALAALAVWWGTRPPPLTPEQAQATATVVARSTFEAQARATGTASVLMAQTTATAEARATAQTQAQARATDVALTGGATRVFGPRDGQIAIAQEHLDQNAVPLFNTGVTQQDFILEVRVFAPFSRSERVWNCAVFFRNSGGNRQYRVTLSPVSDTEGRYSFTLFDGDINTPIGTQTGSIANFDGAAEGSNKLRLVVKGGTALLFVNDQYVATFDTSRKTEAGTIALVTGNGRQAQVAGRAMRYEGLTVWALP